MNSIPLRRYATIENGMILLLAALVCLAYAGSLGGVFLFDDFGFFVNNPRIRQLWPPSEAIAPHARALAEYTFAINYALHGLRPAGYHVVNILIHLGAAILLFGIVRRTLVRPAIPEQLRLAAPWLAGCTAVLWGVHPLQTESVTYLVQRCESLMGLLTLLALYALIRSGDSSRPSRWQLVVVAACLLGMAVKESMAVTPLLLLMYDRTFISGTCRAAWRERRGMYVTLVAALFLLAWLMLAPRTMVNTVPKLTPLEYFRVQLVVIVHYLQLVFLPLPLCFDYGRFTVTWAEAVGPGLIVFGLGLATLASWISRNPFGYPLACFFINLAPTSSVIPVVDVAFERRMYLPLAGILATLVIGGYALLARAPSHMRTANMRMGGLVALLALLLAGCTFVRNQDYLSEVTLWRSVLAVCPDNVRARNDLAVALSEAGQRGEALAQYFAIIQQRGLIEDALQQDAVYDNNSLRMNVFRAYANRGLLHQELGRLDDAERDYCAALELRPGAESVIYKLDHVRRLKKQAHAPRRP